MRRALLAGLAGSLAIAAIALAGAYPPQEFPAATLRVDGEKQRGRIVEASFGYRVGESACVTQDVVGDGRFPRRLRVEADPSNRLRFRVNAERRPDVSLRYWTKVDEDGLAEGQSTPVPIEVAGRAPDGDFFLVANLDSTGKRYLRLSASWETGGICGGEEFLIAHHALAPADSDSEGSGGARQVRLSVASRSHPERGALISAR